MSSGRIVQIIGAVIDVSIPRPRTNEMKDGDEMFSIATEVRRHLAHATASAMLTDERNA